MQEALNDVAGTGAARHAWFIEQVGTYHSEWRAYFVSLIFGARKLEDFSRVPRFTYEEESAERVTGRVLPGLAGLLVLSLVCGGVGIARLPRYPIVG
jgi:ABC-2 type transport system permease protein